MEQKPSLGRIVHYVLPVPAADAERAAIIIRVWSEGAVTLHVFLDPDDHLLERSHLPAGSFLHADVYADVYAHEDKDKAPGSWHWPERE